jgi:hypothetical protein
MYFFITKLIILELLFENYDKDIFEITLVCIIIGLLGYFNYSTLVCILGLLLMLLLLAY